MKMQPKGWGLGVAGLILGAGTALAIGAARPDPEGREHWEYAELLVADGQAVLVSERTTQTVDIGLLPADQSTTYKNDTGTFRRKFQPLLFTMNVFGQQGWEIVSDTPLREGDRVLVRRRR